VPDKLYAPKGVPEYLPPDSAVFRAVHEALAAPVGTLHFAGEHTAGAWRALMEGALRSGIRAADEVLTAS